MVPNASPVSLSIAASTEDIIQVIAASLKDHRIEVRPQTVQIRGLWDSLDWRIASTGMDLESRFTAGSNQAEIFLLPPREYGQRGTLNVDAGSDFALPSAISPTGLGNRVSKLTSGRAILRVAEFEVSFTEVLIFDDLNKHVGTIEIDLVSELHQTWIRLRPKRGYESDLSRAIVAVTEYGSSLATMDSSVDLWRAILWLRGRRRFDYSAGFHVPLDGSMGYEVALGKLLAYLLAAAKRNLDGLFRDIDTEFAHEFRVATRRARSLIAAAESNLRGEVARPLRRRLGEAAAMAGDLRDLDVALEEIPHISWLNTPEVVGKINKLRQASLEALRSYLEGESLNSTLEDWSSLALQLIISDPTDQPPLAQRAAFQLEESRRRMIKLASDSRTHTDAERLHALRKSAKQLRYLLEAYSSIIDQKAASLSISDMKVLQDYLGKLQDRATLAALLDQLKIEPVDQSIFEIPDGVETALAHFISPSASRHWGALISSIKRQPNSGNKAKHRRGL